MASVAIRQVVNTVHASHKKSSPSGLLKPKSPTFITTNIVQLLSPAKFSSKCNLVAVSKASSADSISPVDDDDEGLRLGNMKLPLEIDVARFEILLFQSFDQGKFTSPIKKEVALSGLALDIVYNEILLLLGEL